MSSKNRESVKLNKRKFAAYMVAGAAAAISSNAAEADEITFTTVGSPDGDVRTASLVGFELTDNRFINFSIQGVSAVDLADENGNDVGSFALAGGSIFNYASNFALASGAPDTSVVVNDLTNFAPRAGYTDLRYNLNYSPTFPSLDGFIAFTFTDEADAQQFGFAEIAPLDGGLTFTVERIAFTNNGGTLTIGDAPPAIPEPTSLGLLALGAVGVLSSRRRKLTA